MIVPRLAFWMRLKNSLATHKSVSEKLPHLIQVAYSFCLIFWFWISLLKIKHEILTKHKCWWLTVIIKAGFPICNIFGKCWGRRLPCLDDPTPQSEELFCPKILIYAKDMIFRVMLKIEGKSSINRKDYFQGPASTPCKSGTDHNTANWKSFPVNGFLLLFSWENHLSWLYFRWLLQWKQNNLRLKASKQCSGPARGLLVLLHQ